MIEVRISEDWIERTAYLARQRLSSLRKRNVPTGYGGRTPHEELEHRGVICEFAFQFAVDVCSGQFRDMIYTQGGDGGWDYILPNGKKVDVKGSSPRAAWLIVHDKSPRVADLYVMARYFPSSLTVTIDGWMERLKFDRISTRPPMHISPTACKGVHINSLNPMWEFPYVVRY